MLQNSVLKSKLQSKIEALSIMNKELDKCSMERDRFKVLVEQLKCHRNRLHHQDDKIMYRGSNQSISGGELLANTREQNNMLKVEVSRVLYYDQ